MKHILFIGCVWPEPHTTAAGGRMLQLIEFFKSQNYKITFASAATKNPQQKLLSNSGITTENITLNNSSFDLFLKNINPEMVLFDRFLMEEQFGWRVAQICPSAIRILDTEDLHFLRKHREKEFKGESNGDIRESELAKREIASMYRCDLSLIISDVELAFLKTEFNIPENLLFYLPFLLERQSSEKMADISDFEERQDFISIGNLKHAPNVDSVIFLKEKIWPLLHKSLPATKLHIYGAYAPPKISQLHCPKQNFLIENWAPDAAEVMGKSKIALAPLRFGAGLKGKVILAMQSGTPIITTNIGAEGILEEDLKKPFPRTAKEFAEKAIQLYTNRKLWEKEQRKGFEILNAKFDKQKHSELFRERLISLKNGLSEHRKSNFIGAMLGHHRNKSTYFLSKYIEVKTQLEKIKTP